MCCNKTETRLTEHSKQLEEKARELAALKATISDLHANRSSLLAQCDSDRQRIEDLEFQIEEHRMGTVDASVAASLASSASSSNLHSGSGHHSFSTAISITNKNEETDRDG